MRRLASLVACISVASCGGGSTAPSTPVTPSTVTITGRVSATNGGQPVSGATVALDGVNLSTTDTAGAFRLTISPTVAGALTVTGPLIVTRSARLGASSSRDVTLDAIALDSTFDLAFYRALVRNRTEGDLQPLRRWTKTPSVYLRTVDEAGLAIDTATLDMIEATVRSVVPEWTNGVLGAPTVERGTSTRLGVPGWITVRFPATPSPRCGLSDIAVDGGFVELEVHNQNCRCGEFQHAPRSVRHEFGHAMGFYHTDRSDDLMWGGGFSAALCDAHPTARELVHAAIAYKRPVGNVDPDTDPASAITLTPTRAR